MKPQVLNEQPSESKATQRAMTMLHDMILNQDLFPGEQIRQEELAERASVSRSPLREALRTLAGEGLLVHLPNKGYFVARLSSDELSEVYLMRDLLERELLLSVRTPSEVEVNALVNANLSLRSATENKSVLAMLNANRTFHFLVFELSPLSTVRQEVMRLWKISEPYRAAYLWLPETRERVLAEHSQMIDALIAGDRKKLNEIAGVHRDAAQKRVTELLPGGGH